VVVENKGEAMPTDYDAVVIGSGLGGLTAGALVAHMGSRVLLLERNSSLGGAATTYQRGALTIEASLHETTHPFAPGDPKYELFEALDLEDEIDLVPVPNLQEIRWQGLGEPFCLPHGIDNAEAALVARFPDDRRRIRAFLKQVGRTLRMTEFASPAHDTLWRVLHAAELPLDLWAALRDVRSSLSEVFTRYFGDNEAIKFALAANLPYYSDDPDDFWWLGFAVAQGGYMQGGGYYIRGGSQKLSDTLVAIIRDAGGTVLTESPAVGIDLGADGAVLGVRYRDGETGTETKVTTRHLFANAAPHVIEGMLPEARRSAFMEPFAGRPVSISLVSATLGLEQPPASFGISSYSTMLIPDWMERFSDFSLGTPLLAADPGERLPAICVVDYGQIDSGLVEAEDLNPLAIVCADRLENWDGLDDDAYRARRDAWLDAFVARLDADWPGLAQSVKASTMSTARTMHEHLNTPGGAVYGFAMTPPKELPKQSPRNTKSAVERLWISSAYTGFGGFTGAIGGGIAAAKEALADEH
jgi:all-trans-retinol 13,14-reductase